LINLLLHEIRSRRWAILGWGFGLILFGAVYISIFPEMFEQLTDLKDLSIYRIMGMQLGTIEGYLASVVLTYIPILIGIYCIISSTAILAGEEDTGTLELITAAPLSRRQILTAKVLALIVIVSAILVIAALGNTLLLEIIPFNIPINVTPISFFAALISSLPLAAALIMLGVFLGAILPNRRTAAVVLTVYFIAGFFGENIAGMVRSLEPLKYFSLFNYYNTTAAIFTEGVRFSDTLILLGISAIFFILALIFFQKRNLTVGAWPWQLGKIRD